MRDKQRNGRHEVSPQAGGIYIMRIATVMLAIVSWWATAQGMRDYVFSEEWQANLASLAVQSILLGLNFYLPGFWSNLTGWAGKLGLGVLSAVVLFCSSWFSYVFIVGRVYEQAWDTDSQILVQAAYRTELYDASDYAEEYGKALQENLSERISNLYIQAGELEEESIQVSGDLDLETDLNMYTAEDFAARSEISSAIQAMETALDTAATESDREQANNILTELGTQISNEITSLQDTQIPAAQSATERARDIWDDAEDRLENPTLGADMEDLETAYRQAQENYNRASTYEMELQSDLEDYQEAQRVIQRYLSYLGFSSDNTGLQIESALRTIQRGLLLGGSDATDLDELEKQAVLIFEQLQSDEDGLDVGDSSEYQTMLNDMDRFIREIQDYISVRTVGQNLDAMISDLQSIGQTSQDWKTEWAERLNTLKATIGSLPTYTEGDSAFLRRYERTEAIENLDNALRLYLSDHNAADQAIIYLNCPYRGLAVFSLLLAFFLDIAAFITGFIIDAADKRRENKSQSEPAPLELPPDETVITPATERRYLYLTGDYGKERNVYYYQGMEGAYEVEVELTDGSLTSGFYVERHGELLPVSPQALALSLMPGGPRDGIYRDCALRYQDHMLSIKGAPEKEFRYLATVDDETPVYRMRQGGCISETVRDIRAESWKTVILALNSGGTLVSAIFLEEEIPPKAGRNHIR